MLKKRDDSLEVKVAKTEEEKEEIFRFRYDVYIKELGWPCNADHKNEMFFDSYDETAHQLYVKEGNTIDAVARINFRRDGRLENEDELNIEVFRPYYPDNITKTSKLMVSEHKRKGKLPYYLVIELYRYAYERKSALDFIICSSPQDKFYEKLGYRRYQPNFNHPEYGEVIPMVLFLNDISHLKAINSPFYKIAKELDIKEDKTFYEVKSRIKPYNVHINKKKS